MAKNDFLDQGKTDETIILPKRTHWWVLVVGLLLIALAIGGWFFWNQQNLKSIGTFAECRDAGGAILESYPEQCAINGKTFPNPDQKAPELPAAVDEEPDVEEPKLASYTDTTNSFSIQYPADFVRSEKEVNTPYTNAAVPITSTNFAHTIPVKYCNLKGDCVPNTTDISIAFTVVNSSLDTINQSKVKSELEDFTAGTNKFRYFTQGVEGEGIYYYFISLPNKKTLMISRTYLDENILISYKTSEDFIKKGDQDNLAEQILRSLSFDTSSTSTDTKNWKTFSNSTYGFQLKYPETFTAQPNSFSSGYQVIFQSGNTSPAVVTAYPNTTTSLDKFYYLDFNQSTQKNTLGQQPAATYIAPDGYCDGPGCSPPFIAVAIKKSNTVYVISLSGDTTISTAEQAMLDSFVLTK